MQIYETRIINAAGELSLVAVERHTSDFAAIRAALHLCKERETTQVWREDICIYQDNPPAVRLTWTLHAGRGLS